MSVIVQQAPAPTVIVTNSGAGQPIGDGDGGYNANLASQLDIPLPGEFLACCVTTCSVKSIIT